MLWALSLALDNAGNNMAARIAIMAMTTSNSIRVKPPRSLAPAAEAPWFESGRFIKVLHIRATKAARVASDHARRLGCPYIAAQRRLGKPQSRIPLQLRQWGKELGGRVRGTDFQRGDLGA